MKKAALALGLIAFTTWNLLCQQDGFPELTGPYLGQKPPGGKPEIFASKIFSDNYVYGGFAFSGKSNEVFFFAVDKRGHFDVLYSCLYNGYWTPPRRVNMSLKNQAHPFYSGDENKVIYGSDRRIQANEKVPYFNLWFIERVPEGWSEPRPLSGKINTGWENCGSCDNCGNLFFRRVSPQTRGDLFWTVMVNGKFSDPLKLSRKINTGYDESHPAVSPAGDYIVFSSKRPKGFNNGRDALWVSFRTDDQMWSDAVNLGPTVNNGNNTSCATISRNGKYLFFVRIERGIAVPYWVSAKIIEDLRPKE